MDCIAHYGASNSVKLLRIYFSELATSVLAEKERKQKVYLCPVLLLYPSTPKLLFPPSFSFFLFKSDLTFKFPPTPHTYLYSDLKYVFEPP